MPLHTAPRFSFPSSFWAANAAFWIAYLLIVYLALLLVSPLHPVTLLVNKAGWAATGAAFSAALRPLYARVLEGATTTPAIAAGTIAATAMAASAAWLFGYAVILGWPARLSLPSPRVLLVTYAGLLTALLIWSLGFVTIYLWRTAATERWARTNEERLRREAELESLRHPLNPHFLFNALASIRALVVEDVDRSRLAITQLSELLRDSLHGTARDRVALASELRTGRHYLDLEKIRFEDELEVMFDIDESLNERLVPVFSARAMIENAVKHGQPVHGRVDIAIRTRAAPRGGLFIEVTNTGRLSAELGATAVGLRNLRERLARLYPGNHAMSLTESDGIVTALLWLAPDAGKE